MLLHLCEICLSLVDGSSNYDIEIQLATSDFPPQVYSLSTVSWKGFQIQGHGAADDTAFISGSLLRTVRYGGSGGKGKNGPGWGICEYQMPRNGDGFT